MIGAESHVGGIELSEEHGNDSLVVGWGWRVGCGIFVFGANEIPVAVVELGVIEVVSHGPPDESEAKALVLGSVAFESESERIGGRFVALNEGWSFGGEEECFSVVVIAYDGSNIFRY